MGPLPPLPGVVVHELVGVRKVVLVVICEYPGGAQVASLYATPDTKKLPHAVMVYHSAVVGAATESAMREHADSRVVRSGVPVHDEPVYCVTLPANAPMAGCGLAEGSAPQPAGSAKLNAGGGPLTPAAAAVPHAGGRPTAVKLYDGAAADVAQLVLVNSVTCATSPAHEFTRAP